MGGHNSYTFTGNASQLSYRPFKFSGESDSIKALRKEALISLRLQKSPEGRENMNIHIEKWNRNGSDLTPTKPRYFQAHNSIDAITYKFLYGIYIQSTQKLLPKLNFLLSQFTANQQENIDLGCIYLQFPLIILTLIPA